MTELQILNAVKNNGGSIDFAYLINLGKTDRTWEPLTDRRLIEKLISEKVLSGNTGGFATISFGENGLLRLRDLQNAEYDSYQKLTNETSKESRQRNHEWRMVFATAILSSLGTVLAQIVIQLLFGA